MSFLSIQDLFSVKGRVAVVTGGSSGIGLMISKVYVVALASDSIDEVVSELNQLGCDAGGSAFGMPCDLTSKDAITELALNIAKREQHVDILISNAGIRRDPPQPCSVLSAPLSVLQRSMYSTPPEDWSDTFATNVTAHYFMSVAFMHLLETAANRRIEGGVDDGATERRGKDEGRGVVVITSSAASLHNMTNVDLTSYAASKAATDHVVRLLAAKFSRWYVRVVGINPGFVPSRMNPVGAQGNIFSNLFDQVPAKRAGKPEDIAGTILYLVSKAGAYVDGVSLCIDGGRVLLANGQQ